MNVSPLVGRNTFVNVHVNKALTSHRNRQFCAQLHDYKNTIKRGRGHEEGREKAQEGRARGSVREPHVLYASLVIFQRGNQYVVGNCAKVKIFCEAFCDFSPRF